MDHVPLQDDGEFSICLCGGKLIAGPSGGMATNCVCEACEAKWNVVMHPFAFMMPLNYIAETRIEEYNDRQNSEESKSKNFFAKILHRLGL